MNRELAPAVRVAPAKLNLTLAVIGRRSDGFHSLHSVMVPLGLADRLSVAVLARGTDTLHVSGRDAGPNPANLVLRAVAAARSAVGGSGPTPPLAIRLDKRIPVAAGLAGGSSDAAAALDASLEAWGATLDPATLMGTAAAIGSDVPFFLAGGPALVEGRGERVTRLHGLRAGSSAPWVLLVTPAVPMSTAAVFAAWAAGAMGEPGVVRRTSEHFASEFGSGISRAAFLERAGVLAAANDLLPAAAAVMPELIPIRRRLMRLLGRPVGLSGSGPTLWTLYAAEGDATSAADRVREAVADGSLPAPEGAPFIEATQLAIHPSAAVGPADRPADLPEPARSSTHGGPPQ